MGSSVVLRPEALSLGIVDELAAKGYCVRDGFLSSPVVSRYRNTLRRRHEDGCFRPAAIGRRSELQVETSIRSDDIMWLHEAQLGWSFRRLRDILDRLQEDLNRHLYLGIRNRELHGAIYSPGAFYRRHLDQHRATADRLITVIVYLNQNWQPADGGYLRMYDDQFPGGQLDVAPLGGRAVIFASDRFPHEVLLAHRERMSITGWLRRESTLPL